MEKGKAEEREDGAGEGNRTPVVSLGSFCSTIELHPHFDRAGLYPNFHKLFQTAKGYVLVLSLICPPSPMCKN